jgi:hypothetical protein
MTIFLTPQEIAQLDRQRPETRRDGGFQGMIVDFQFRVDRRNGRLTLTARDLERIPRYAFDYRRGGWQQRLQRIFGRTLGPNLGRRHQRRAA